jgi:hypothetical protein
VQTVVSSTAKEYFQRALLILLPLSPDAHLTTRGTICRMNLVPHNVPRKKQFFSSSEFNHPDLRRKEKPVLVNDPTVK